MGSMYWAARLPSRTCSRIQQSTPGWPTWFPLIGMTVRIQATGTTCIAALSYWKCWVNPAYDVLIWWSTCGTCGGSERGSRRMTRRRPAPTAVSPEGSTAAIVMGSWTSARTTGCPGSRRRRRKGSRWRWRPKSRPWRGCRRREWGPEARVCGGGRGPRWGGGREIEWGRRPWRWGEKTKWSPMTGWGATGIWWLLGAPIANRLISGSSFPSSTEWLDGNDQTVAVRPPTMIMKNKKTPPFHKFFCWSFGEREREKGWMGVWAVGREGLLK